MSGSRARQDLAAAQAGPVVKSPAVAAVDLIAQAMAWERVAAWVESQRLDTLRRFKRPRVAADTALGADTESQLAHRPPLANPHRTHLPIAATTRHRMRNRTTRRTRQPARPAAEGQLPAATPTWQPRCRLRAQISPRATRGCQSSLLLRSPDAVGVVLLTCMRNSTLLLVWRSFSSNSSKAC